MTIINTDPLKHFAPLVLLIGVLFGGLTLAPERDGATSSTDQPVQISARPVLHPSEEAPQPSLSADDSTYLTQVKAGAWPGAELVSDATLLNLARVLRDGWAAGLTEAELIEAVTNGGIEAVAAGNIVRLVLAVYCTPRLMGGDWA